MPTGKYERVTVQKAARAISKRGGEAKIRKEYSRLREIANDRIKRAQRNGELMEEDVFGSLREIRKGDTERLAKAYSNVTKFLNSKRSTEYGRAEIRQKTVESLKNLGYEGISTGNVDLFGKFMENFRRKYETETPEGKKLLMDSDFAVEAFDAISERFTSRTNSRAMSRYFNQYLRDEGMEEWIVTL